VILKVILFFQLDLRGKTAMSYEASCARIARVLSKTHYDVMASKGKGGLIENILELLEDGFVGYKNMSPHLLHAKAKECADKVLAYDLWRISIAMARWDSRYGLDLYDGRCDLDEARTQKQMSTALTGPTKEKVRLARNMSTAPGALLILVLDDDPQVRCALNENASIKYICHILRVLNNVPTAIEEAHTILADNPYVTMPLRPAT
jgi:hypothetical protein